jgi:hypothetical protein
MAPRRPKRPRDSVVLHRQVLSNLRIIRNHFAESSGVDHNLYAVQINPCDRQHFIRARIGFPESGRIRLEMHSVIQLRKKKTAMPRPSASDKISVTIRIISRRVDTQ